MKWNYNYLSLRVWFTCYRLLASSRLFIQWGGTAVATSCFPNRAEKQQSLKVGNSNTRPSHVKQLANRSRESPGIPGFQWWFRTRWGGINNSAAGGCTVSLRCRRKWDHKRGVRIGSGGWLVGGGKRERLVTMESMRWCWKWVEISAYVTFSIDVIKL